MKKLALSFLLLLPINAAVAQEDAPVPATVELPTQDWKGPDGAIHGGIASLRKALGSLPYDQVSPFIEMLTLCVSVQVPDKGMIRDMGQCPAVSQARRASAEHAKELADLRNKLAASDKELADIHAKNTANVEAPKAKP